MLRLIPALILILFTLPSSAVEGSPEQLFQQGLAAYQSKNFEHAREAFQKILSANENQIEALHNLALTQYQLGQKPLALALWRKALSMDPGYSHARRARSFVENELNQRGYERDHLSALMRDYLDHVSLHQVLWVVALILGISGWLWLRYVRERRLALNEARPLPEFPTTAVILSAVFLSSLIFAGLKAQFDFRVRGTVISATTQAKSLPTEEGVALFELRGGSEVLVRRKEKDWLQVINSSGASGWVKDSELFVTSGL